MNRDQARNLIRQTFTQSFDKTCFRNFTFNVLNRVDELKAAQWNTTYVKNAFRDHVHRYERLGTYTSPEKEKLDVLIVHLTKESKLEWARTTIRNFVADHLKNRHEKDAALVAFVSPTERQWRFSYVKMEYATIEKDSGKVGVETRLTPARRFSYLVGEGESCHTAQTRFLDLLQNTDTDPALAEIEEAFSVEAVTKEFFTKYTELFQEIYGALEKLVAKDKTIREEFKARGVNPVDFAKKLMGQIVFLYFLQKKGWLGVATGQDWGSGSRDFLRRLANGEHGQYDNFFNDILEPLFYDTLATDRGHEAWCNRFKCRIPFLNGGLFEPLGDYNWRKSDVLLPNRLFTNSDQVEEGITGTGVLDVFDRYNFTVNEAEPLEKEVAIDPEMLGKVFENLIEENRRKGLGAYYTPREIVHYMCQESLINYLDTAINTAHETIAAEKPKQGKLFGAPEPEQQSLKTTAYREIVRREDIETFVHLGEQISHYESVNTKYPVKMPKSIQGHARLIDEKLADITVCDPAVGSGAFPVGMMTEIVRARCALTPYFNDVHERTPYHFKRHAIQNCMYGVDIDAGAVDIAKLRLWLSLVVDEEDVKQIKPLPNLDYKVVAGNSLRGIEKGQLENWKAIHRLETLKPLYFDEVDKKKKDTYRQEIDDLIHKLTDGGTIFDFEIYFSEVFHKKRGFDVVIANPPYIPIEQMTDHEKTTYQSRNPELSRKFDSSVVFVLESLRLLNNGGYLCFISSLTWQTGENYAQMRRTLVTKYGIVKIVNLPFDIFESVYVDTGIYVLASRTSPHYVLVRFDKKDTELDFLSAVAQIVPISAIEPPHYRVVLDVHVAEVIRRCKARGFVSLGDVTKSTQGLAGSAFRRTNHRDSGFPFVEKGQVYRYVLVIETVVNVDISEHQNLVPFYDVGPKILIRRVINRQDRLMATLTEDQYLFKKDVNPFRVKDDRFLPEYLLGLINSRFISWLYVNSSSIATKDDFRQTTLAELRHIPVPLASRDDQAFMTQLVKQVLIAKKINPDTDVSSLEDEIDQLVYCLYGLTPEEIAIVEGSQKRR